MEEIQTNEEAKIEVAEPIIAVDLAPEGADKTVEAEVPTESTTVEAPVEASTDAPVTTE